MSCIAQNGIVRYLHTFMSIIMADIRNSAHSNDVAFIDYIWQNWMSTRNNFSEIFPLKSLYFTQWDWTPEYHHARILHSLNNFECFEWNRFDHHRIEVIDVKLKIYLVELLPKMWTILAKEIKSSNEIETLEKTTRMYLLFFCFHSSLS